MTGRRWWPRWDAREWRMIFALIGLSVAGLGAWLLNKYALDALIDLSDKYGSAWPVAYYAYGSLLLLGLPSVSFAVVVGLKSFGLTGPAGTSATFGGNGE